FVSRDPATSSGRSVRNLDIIEHYLMSQGFEIYYPERHSISEQADAFSAASVVVGIHGAGMTNIVFCQKNAVVVEFYGEHVAPCYWAISSLLGLMYHNHCCADISRLPASDSARTMSLAARRIAPFSISIDDVKTVLKNL
ncbi:glycosyltransferase family 61 protein, partial [bacterium]|nr:glycosyltransferase family 61 protein [bacterium]